MIRRRSLKRELEMLRGELAERERQLKRCHTEVLQLRRRLAKEASAASADAAAAEASAHRARLAAPGLNGRRPVALLSCSRARPQTSGNGRKPAGEPRWASRRPLADPGGVFSASTAIHCAGLELLFGELAQAEEELRRAQRALAAVGEQYLLAPIAALLAQVLDAQGRVEEAELIGRRRQELAASGEAEALWPSLQASALAWQERAEAAEWRAREAVELIRIGAALSRLRAWYSSSACRQGDRSASAWRA